MEITTRQIQAMETKRHIFHAALRILKENGYTQMTIRTICKEAGVSTGAFYHYFSSKDDVLHKIFETYDNELENYLKTYSESNPIKALQSIILSLTEYIWNYGASVAKQLYLSQLSIDNNYIVRSDRLFYQTVTRYAEEALQQDLIRSDHSAQDIAEYLIRLNRGVILDWCLHDYSYDLLGQAKNDLNMALSAILTDKAHL